MPFPADVDRNYIIDSILIISIQGPDEPIWNFADDVFFLLQSAFKMGFENGGNGAQLFVNSSSDAKSWLSINDMSCQE